MTKRGVGIIEVVMAVALVALLMVVLTEIFVAGSRGSRISAGKTEAQIDNFQTMNQLTQTLSEADKILASQTVNGTSYSSGLGSLVAELPAVSQTGAPLVGFDYAAVHVDAVNPAKLYLETQAIPNSKRLTGHKLLTDTLSEINFKYDADPASARLVTVYLKTAKSSDSITDQAVSTSTIYLQNK